MSLLCSCAHSVPRDRILYLSGTKVFEAYYGVVERWVAFEKNKPVGYRKVVFQVDYFKGEKKYVKPRGFYDAEKF